MFLPEHVPRSVPHSNLNSKITIVKSLGSAYIAKFQSGVSAGILTQDLPIRNYVAHGSLSGFSIPIGLYLGACLSLLFRCCYNSFFKRRTPSRTPKESRRMAIDPKDFPEAVKPNLKANIEFDKFYYRFNHEGKTHKGLIDFSRKSWGKKDRIKFAEVELFKAKEKARSTVNEDSTIDQIVQLYYDTLPEGRYKKAKASYYYSRVQPTLGKKIAREVLPMHIQKLVNLNIKNGDSPRTAKQAIESLSPAFKIARANRIVSHNPCDDVKIKLPKTRKIVVNATERLTLIYKTVVTMFEKDPYYRAFFLLAVQGRRKGEIINLRWENISFEYDYYFLPNTKNDEEQKIFLPPNVKEALLEFRGSSGWVFESVAIPGQRLCDARWQTARLKKSLGSWFTMHYTRNVMVSAMAEQGVDAIYMSGALGHNDPNTITKYLTMSYLKGSKIASGMMQG